MGLLEDGVLDDPLNRNVLRALAMAPCPPFRWDRVEDAHFPKGLGDLDFAPFVSEDHCPRPIVVEADFQGMAHAVGKIGRQLRDQFSSKRELAIFHRKHRSLDPVHQSIPGIELNVCASRPVQTDVDDHHVWELRHKSQEAFEDSAPLVLAYDTIGDPTSSANELVRMDFLAQEDPVVPLQDDTMLADLREALAPVGMSNRDRGQTEAP